MTETKNEPTMPVSLDFMSQALNAMLDAAYIGVPSAEDHKHGV